MCFPDITTIKTLVFMGVILCITFMAHALLHGYGKNHHPNKTEQERIRSRSKWLLFAIIALIAGGQYQDFCMTDDWMLIFLSLVGLVIWELIFFLTSDPPIENSPVANSSKLKR